MESKVVLAIDPGRSKCGMALVERDGAGKISLIWRGVKPREETAGEVTQLLGQHSISLIILGNGTTSRPLAEAIREDHPGIGILVVDEKDTTLQARERYWEHNSRFGWRRFLPSTLQVPPVPYDDFVALILAERVLSA